ncbi:crotonase/enoyl-CoA hydratase family protein [Yunchengibacter salinarum]|uniref:crotonase/enoyl-CoA hydratase family protein n=1 Tax=Yunchengibacter salinarum TaxID=3133399 RepID=UPI0035B5A8F5
MDFSTLTVERKDSVAHVSLNRPDTLNAFNGQMFNDLWEVFSHFADDTGLRAVVLSGQGKHFTSGLDLKDNAGLFNQEGDPARVREKFHRHIKWLQKVMDLIDECPVPTIAAVHGACIGAGVDLIAACDMRLATENAWFSIQEVNVAIVADLGTLQRAPHILPQGILRELAYTGRKFPVKEAARYGFVNGVLDDQATLKQAAFDLADEIAAKSPLAVRGTKRVLNHARDNSIRDGLDYVAAWNSGMLIGEDLMKAAGAALSKGSVSFDDLLDNDE